jgi:hypothetical protein
MRLRVDVRPMGTGYHRRETADHVNEGKRPETRERRAAKAVREHLG